jgi:hypothetical protein
MRSTNLASGPVSKWEIVGLWSLVRIATQPVRTCTPGSDLLRGLSRQEVGPVRTGVLGSYLFEVCLGSALTCTDTRGHNATKP